MPGVNITTTARGDAAAPLAGASGQLFIAGLAERGRTDKATIVRGLADFESQFGFRTSYSHLYDSVRCYFEEGGTQAYVARVIGPAATSGLIAIVDRAPEPIATVNIAARSQGAWSLGLKVVVSDGTLPGTIRATIILGQTVVESINNIQTVEGFVSRFNFSNYVKVTNAGSASVAPANLPSVGEYILTAGADDRDSVTPADYIAALSQFPEGLGDGAVAIPGIGTAVHEGLIRHATENRRIALLSDDLDATPAELTETAGALGSDAAGLFAPWGLLSDNAGGSRPVPPEGYVAGVRARAHKEVGVHRAPAGGVAVSESLVGVYVEYPKAVAEALNDAKVSVIRQISNTTRLYGWRSLSNDVANFGYLNHRDVLNRVVVEAELRLEQYVFAPIDAKGQVLASINAELTGILEPLREVGALYERENGSGGTDGGYLVETGSSVNTDASLANNEIRARVSLRVSPIGERVSLNIVKVGLLQGLQQ